jgi:hypothetical protein
MKLATRLALGSLAIVGLSIAGLAAPARAQSAAFVRLFRPYHQVALAQLAEVETDLKLTDEQKTKALDLYDELNEERRAIWQESAGDFEGMIEETGKLAAEIAEEFAKSLDETQQKRLQGLYVQTNGPTALFDPKIAEALKLTDEQKAKLTEARIEVIEGFRDGGVDWQSLSEEEAAAEVDKMIADQDAKYSAVLTDEQRTELETLKGEKLEIDLNKLPNPFGG